MHFSIFSFIFQTQSDWIADLNIQESESHKNHISLVRTRGFSHILKTKLCHWQRATVTNNTALLPTTYHQPHQSISHLQPKWTSRNTCCSYIKTLLDTMASQAKGLQNFISDLRNAKSKVCYVRCIYLSEYVMIASHIIVTSRLVSLDLEAESLSSWLHSIFALL